MVRVTAADIKSIANLPREVVHELGYLATNPSALVHAVLSIYLHESKAGRAITAAERALHTVEHGAILKTTERFVKHYAADEAHKIAGEVRDSLIKAALTDVGLEDLPNLMNIAQAALTAATVARTVAEAAEFERRYPKALKQPAGKHFLLDVETIFKTKTVTLPTIQVTATHHHAVTPASQTEIGQYGGLRVVGAAQLGRTSTRTRTSETSTSHLGVGVGVDVQAFIYWWAGRK